MDNRKRLRAYLKNYRMWQGQARDIERSIASGKVPEPLKGELTKVKDDFIRKCRNVQTIIGYSKSELERRVLNLSYIDGKSMKQIAREVGYSYGYCGNIESRAIKRMSIDPSIMALLGQ